jgi:FtsZ-binding cell division protein ZapB
MTEIIQTNQDELQNEFMQLRDAIENSIEFNSNSVELINDECKAASDLKASPPSFFCLDVQIEDDVTEKDLPRYRIKKDYHLELQSMNSDILIEDNSKSVELINSELIVSTQFEITELKEKNSKLEKELFEVAIQMKAAKAHNEFLLNQIGIFALAANQFVAAKKAGLYGTPENAVVQLQYIAGRFLKEVTSYGEPQV